MTNIDSAHVGDKIKLTYNDQKVGYINDFEGIVMLKLISDAKSNVFLAKR